MVYGFTLSTYDKYVHLGLKCTSSKCHENTRRSRKQLPHRWNGTDGNILNTASIFLEPIPCMLKRIIEYIHRTKEYVCMVGFSSYRIPGTNLSPRCQEKANHLCPAIASCIVESSVAELSIAQARETDSETRSGEPAHRLLTYIHTYKYIKIVMLRQQCMQPSSSNRSRTSFEFMQYIIECIHFANASQYTLYAWIIVPHLWHPPAPPLPGEF